MRTITTILLLLLSVCCYGQTDSTESKLTKYKGMYEKGLIDSAEYSQLKGSVLFNNQKPVSLENLKSRYKSYFVAGGLFIAAGTGLVVGGLLYNPKGVYSTNQSNYQENLAAVKRNRYLLLGTGGVCLVAGAIFTSLGIASRVSYTDKRGFTVGILDSGNAGISFGL